MNRKLYLSSYALLLSVVMWAQKPLDIAQTYITSQLENWELKPADIAEMRLNDQYTSAHNGVTHIYFLQQYQGIDVNNAMINLNILEDGEVLFARSRFVSDLQTKIKHTHPTISAADALLSAALHLKVEEVDIGQPKTVVDKHTFIYEGGHIARRDIKVKLEYLIDGEQVHLVWALDIDVQDSPDYWTIKVDAQTAEILSQHNYTVYCTHEHHKGGICRDEIPQFLPSLLNNNTDGARYNVFAVPVESPIHGTRSLVVNPADGTASPYGWHDTDGVPGAEYTITRGNNVHAYPDTTDANEPMGLEPDGGSELVFDFPYQEGLEPDSFLDFATTQLFYMNNVMHDFSYAYGFTEAAGNFQMNNYGKGGEEEDFVIANAQDGGGSNNANFGTPPDGSNGFMQMYTWSRNGLLTVTEPLFLAGIYETRTAGFGPQIIEQNIEITAEVAIADDGSSNPTLACNEIQNDLTGKIALIDRGECFFSTKVYHAELAGAVAVIICNYDGGSFSGMAAGTDDPITIPSLMMQYNDCLRLRETVGQLVVEISVPEDEGPSAIDGTLDNGIIAHEYGHGISNRLTGGPRESDCLFNDDQMGEGWSDYFSLVTTVHPKHKPSRKRGIGTYVQQQGTNGAGIRRYPYSSDMQVNPQTYKDIIGTGVHATGEVWAVTLWDLYWAMTDKYGWDEDLYHGTGGNNMAIQLVMDGMKFQPCAPGFIDGRDAILAADRALYDGANQCLIWEVFARRGLGWNAIQGDVNDSEDGFEDFEPMPTCVQELKLVKEILTDEIKAGDDITVKLTLTNHKLETVTGISITDIIPEGASFAALEDENINHSLLNLSANTSSIEILIDSLTAGENTEIVYTLHTSPDLYSIRYFFDDMESGDEAWLVEPIGISSGEENSDSWRLDPNRGVASSSGWYIPATLRDNDQALQLFEPFLVTGENPALRFTHRYQTEWADDGGIVEVLPENATSWQALDTKLFKNVYPTSLAYGAFAIPNLGGFTGDGLTFRTTYIDLSDYIGQNVAIRFRFGSDDDTSNPNEMPRFGWTIDNIELLDVFNYNSEACATSTQGDVACDTAEERGAIVSTETPTTSTEEITDEAIRTVIYPNPTKGYINLDITSKEKTDLIINIYTPNGQNIMQKENQLQEGRNHLVVRVDELSEGFYLVELRSKNTTTFQKVVIAQ